MKRHTIHLLCQRSVLQGFNQSDQIVPDSQERRDSTRPRTGIFFNCCLAGPGGPFLYLWFCTSNSTFPATSSTQSEMLAFTIVLDRISKHAQGALINLHSRLTRINSLSLSLAITRASQLIRISLIRTAVLERASRLSCFSLDIPLDISFFQLFVANLFLHSASNLRILDLSLPRPRNYILKMIYGIGLSQSSRIHHLWSYSRLPLALFTHNNSIALARDFRACRHGSPRDPTGR